MEPNPGPGPGPGTMDPLLEEDLFTPSHDDQLSFSLEDVVDPGSTTFGSFDGDSIPQEQQQEWQQQYTNFMADALQDAGPATASASVSPVPVASQSPEPGVPLTAIDEFFLRAGAFRPPNPCAYCTRRRLQCTSLTYSSHISSCPMLTA